jgi:hypothetical protein
LCCVRHAPQLVPDSALMRNPVGDLRIGKALWLG